MTARRPGRSRDGQRCPCCCKRCWYRPPRPGTVRPSPSPGPPRRPASPRRRSPSAGRSPTPTPSATPGPASRRRPSSSTRCVRRPAGTAATPATHF
ncbi:hypothetical protein CXR04_04635 [Streptomyces sp. CMB-StM0423]|nr:hypothetical protein CXR04_04635 [Streptomyces sp. CMB-StM0423]